MRAGLLHRIHIKLRIGHLAWLDPLRRLFYLIEVHDALSGDLDRAIPRIFTDFVADSPHFPLIE
jgi:hypothetical protein